MEGEEAQGAEWPSRLHDTVVEKKRKYNMELNSTVVRDVKRSRALIKLVFSRGPGSFSIEDINPSEETVFTIKEKVCERFNEMYPEGVDPPLDWTEPRQLSLIKAKIVSRGIGKSKNLIKEMI